MNLWEALQQGSFSYWDVLQMGVIAYGVLSLSRSLYRWVRSLFGLPKAKAETYRRLGRQERNWGWLPQDRHISRQWRRFYWEGYHEADQPHTDPLESS